MFAKVVLSSLVVTLVCAEYTISDQCLDCICQACTQCDTSFNCTKEHCGPFLISYDYWVDSKRPVLLHDVPENEGAFQACVTDMPCAAETIENYVRKYDNDCNGDGVVDCIDYAYAHRMGPSGCHMTPPDNLYFRSIKKCIKKIEAQENFTYKNIQLRF
ncbi:lysozyme-like isoform X2 [Oratosquilla oratoria]|uniref:lysozyme-like isoform X2 n=1 Tax=Oratosquilla oratoria TaxID=337810 RepID=UPI003F776F58